MREPTFGVGIVSGVRLAVKKILIGLGVLVLVGGFVAYKNKTRILLHIVASRGLEEVGSNRPISWDAGPNVASQQIADRPPNIIFILADDLGINDISAFGGGIPGVPTPNIDALAHDGALFRQAYAGNATCAPSRGMLMTGRYPTRTGFEFTPTPDGMGRMVSIISNEMKAKGEPLTQFNSEVAENAPTYDDQGLPGEEITIAELLKGQGYHNVHIGKWHMGRNDEMSPNAQGFDESLLMESGLYLPPDDPNVVNAKLDFDPIDQFLWARMQYSATFNGSKPFRPGGYLTDYWTDEAMKVIDANKNRPFFLYLAHWGAHTPLQATREDYEAVGDIGPHRLRVYAAMVRALDRSVKRIVEKLEAEGLSDNTILVFSSDNGGAGYVGLPEVNAPYRGWKLTLFEGGIRAPLFIKWPAKINPNTVVDAPVAHIDVMPTLAAAGGAELPAGVEIDGKNLLPIATGTGSLSRENDALYWQSGYTRVVRAGNWKLQIDGKQNKKWLFDLADDPTEQVNLAENRADKLAELQGLMEQHFSNARTPLYQYTIENAVMIDKTLNEEYQPGDEYAWWPN